MGIYVIPRPTLMSILFPPMMHRHSIIQNAVMEIFKVCQCGQYIQLIYKYFSQKTVFINKMQKMQRTVYH